MNEIREKPSIPYLDFEFNDKNQDFQNFKHIKDLKFGDLFQYKDLDEYWYFDKETNRIRFVNKKTVKLILDWNKYDLKPNQMQFEKLISIKGLPSSKYSFYSKHLEFPAKVKLNSGTEIDFCIILVTKTAPFQNYYQNVILLNDVKEIIESEFALPHKYRISSMNAKEVMMSTYPYVVKSKSGENLVYNGKTQFTSYGETKGDEIIEEIKFNQNIKGKFYDLDYKKITFVLADWNEKSNELYDEYIQYVIE